MANYRRVIPFVRKWEGGLSRKKSDTASKYPSPCVYKGLKGWHTNKGVTWQTFKGKASKLGYTASCSNFINLPDSIWENIFKNSYWDRFNLDDVKSQAIAELILGFAWGSGVGGATKQIQKFLKNDYDVYIPRNKWGLFSTENKKKMVDTINTLSKGAKEKGFLDKFIEHKRKFLISLNQPANINGWLNRLDEFKQEAYKLLGKKTVKTAVYVGVGVSVVGILTAIYFIVSND